MSELKAYRPRELVMQGRHNEPIYLKSEADKVIAELEEKLDIYKRGWMENDRVNANQYAEIRHHKYKRCLAMAKLCHWKMGVFIYKEEKSNFYHRWFKRWLELAEKFKTNSTSQQGKEEAK